ncbi:MAG: hypothetical protein KatS3mg105_3240 [Gemmatales bacterium]|nr:MAG: hypothetical protein KatS3mg105_3240 [Gemmatales bacterium]
MQSVFESIRQIDMQAVTRQAMDSIEQGDPRFLAVVIAILVFIGSKMVSGQPGLKRLGLRLGAAIALIYGGYLYFYLGAAQAESPWFLALRSLNAGGGVLAFTWIVLPVLNFVFNHLRLALAAFLGYTGYEIVLAGGFDQEQFPNIALRGLGAVALTLIVAWIVHPIWDYLRGILPEPRRNNEETQSQRSERFRRALRRARRQRARRHDRDVPTRLSTSPSSAEEDDLDDEWLTVRSASSEALEERRRREKARFKLELFYLSVSPDIGHRFTRAMFDDFLNRYMGDHLPVEDVEDNARQLYTILQQQQQQCRQAAGATTGSLEELGRWFLEEQRRLLAEKNGKKTGFVEHSPLPDYGPQAPHPTQQSDSSW